MKGKAKILIIGVTPPPIHGAAIYFDNLINSELLNSDFQILHLNTRMSNDNWATPKVTLTKLFLGFKYMLVLLRYYATMNVKIVFTQISYSTSGLFKDFFIIGISKLFKKPIIVTILGSGQKERYLESGKIYKYFMLRSFSNADLILVHTKNMIERDWLEQTQKFRTYIIPYATKPMFNINIAKSNLLNKDANKITIIFMSTFTRSKGIFDTLHAAVKILNSDLNVRFVFAGEWQNKEDEAEATSILRGIVDRTRVDFPGYISMESKKSYLLGCDIFVLPTYYPTEDMPLAILDSMNAGLAIVTTQHAGIPEVIKENVNGLFCQKQDPEDIAAKMSILIKNANLLRQMQLNNVNEYFDKYSYNNYEKKIDQILKSMAI